MSLILEALRKSEAQRRRAQAPDLRAELPPAPLQRRVAIPAWAWLLPSKSMSCSRSAVSSGIFPFSLRRPGGVRTI